MTTLQRTSITAVAALMIGTIAASARELPQYEVAGFPITTLQLSIIGSRGVQEQSPASTLTLDGMPASPHQIAVVGRSPINGSGADPQTN
jgi:hypothetical protein